jgi:hypothetical protein
MDSFKDDAPAFRAFDILEPGLAEIIRQELLKTGRRFIFCIEGISKEIDRKLMDHELSELNLEYVIQDVLRQVREHEGSDELRIFVE